MLRVLLAGLLAVLALAPTASAVQPGLAAGHTEASGTYVFPEDAAQELGAGWVGLDLHWSFVEPTEGVLDENAVSSYYDHLLSIFAARGTKVLLTLANAPSWAVADPENHHHAAPPKDPAHVASLLSRLAARPAWKGVVAGYEVWREPDTAAGWHPAPSAPAYAAVLKAASGAVRQADPAAKVVLGGLDGADVAFLSAVYDAGVTSADIDAIGVRAATPCRLDAPGAYYREPDGRLGRYAFSGYRELYQESLERGDADPVWVTGMGVSTLTDTCAEGSGAGQRLAGVSEDQQAQWLKAAYSCLAADTYVGPALWNLQDVDEDRSRSLHWLGLFRFDGTQKPAAAAFGALKAGITPDPACGGRVDTIAPTVQVAAAPTFTDALRIDLTATDGETPVGRTYLTVRRADQAPEQQVPIPGGGQGGTYGLTWNAASQLPLGVPHVITGYAFDEARNLGGASVTVTRVAPAVPGAKPVVQAATSAAVSVSAKKGRRAIANAELTYTPPAGSALKGRGRLVFEFYEKPRRGKARWVQAARFTVLASALRRARITDRRTGKRVAKVTKAAKLTGSARKWRVLFEFDGVEPYQDSRAMTQFRAKG